MSTLNIAMTFDAAYAKYAAVTALSAIIHTPGPIAFTFLVHEPDDAELGLLLNTARRFGATTSVCRVDHAAFEGWRLGEQDHFSRACYYRLLLPREVAASRCLYLDSDLIVTTDLRPLLEADLGNALIAGCVDPRAQKDSPMIEVISDGIYLNTGVLIMDLDGLRALDLLNAAESEHRRHADRLLFGDQCLINKTLDGRKAVLEARWNVQAHAHRTFHYEQIMAPWDRRAIFHGSGQFKPWMSWSDPWLHGLWVSYARLVETPLDGLILQPRNPNERMRLIRMLEETGQWQRAAKEKDRIIRFLNASPKTQST